LCPTLKSSAEFEKSDITKDKFYTQKIKGINKKKKVLIVLYEYIIFFALAFIVSFSSTPIAKKIAFSVGAVDVPNDARRIHKKPVARLGGLAIFTGFLVSLLFGILSTYLNMKGIVPSRQLFGMLIGAFIIVAVGIVDDIKQLGPRLKLVFQIMAALSVIFISDIRIVNITNPFAEGGTTQFNDFVSYPLTGQQFELTITDEKGNEVYRYSDGKFFTLALIMKTINPGESIKWQDEWDMKDKDGNKLTSGKYKAKIEIMVVQEEEKEKIDESELTTEIEFELGVDEKNNIVDSKSVKNL